jgi:hypothetical protein
MIRKTLIAAAALALLAGAASSQAEAKVHINGTINIGLPGGFDGYPYYGDGPYFYDEDPGCGYEWVKHKKWVNGHKKIWYSKEYVCG